MFLKVLWRLSGLTIRGAFMTAQVGAILGLITGVGFALLLLVFGGYEEVDDIAVALLIFTLEGMAFGILFTLLLGAATFFIATALNPTNNFKAWFRRVGRTAAMGMACGWIFGAAIGISFAVTYNYFYQPTWPLPPTYLFLFSINLHNWFHAAVAWGYVIGAMSGVLIGHVIGVLRGVSVMRRNRSISEG